MFWDYWYIWLSAIILVLLGGMAGELIVANKAIESLSCPAAIVAEPEIIYETRTVTTTEEFDDTQIVTLQNGVNTCWTEEAKRVVERDECKTQLDLITKEYNLELIRCVGLVDPAQCFAQ